MAHSGTESGKDPDGGAHSQMMLEPEVILLLVLVAAAAGFVDAIAGGGGLLTLPALLLAGLPPVDAIATNKLQGTFGVAAASHAFWRAGQLDVSALLPAIAATGVGALAGSMSVLLVSPDWLRPLVPLMLLAVAFYFMLAPGLTISKRDPRVPLRLLVPALGAFVGFYDGFFGPGTGSFLMLGLVSLGGLSLLTATANTKLLNFTSNIASVAVFAAAGHIHLATGLAMAAGQISGATLGAHVALRSGARLIRPLVIAVSLAVAMKLLLDPGPQMQNG